jgi:hypothetical protein
VVSFHRCSVRAFSEVRNREKKAEIGRVGDEEEWGKSPRVMQRNSVGNPARQPEEGPGTRRSLTTKQCAEGTALPVHMLRRFADAEAAAQLLERLKVPRVGSVQMFALSDEL